MDDQLRPRRELSPQEQMIEEAARQAKDMNNAPLPPGQIMPGPLPTSMAISKMGLPDGTIIIRLECHTPQGVNFFFLDPQAARSIGQALQKAASTLDVGAALASVPNP